MKTQSELIKNRLLELDPSITGEVKLSKAGNVVTAKCHVNTQNELVEQEFKTLVNEMFKLELVAFDINVNQGLTVIALDSFDTTNQPKGVLDELDILYYGMLDTSMIEPNTKHKFINNERYLDIKNIIVTLNFIAPIVLDSSLKVIDGNLRLDIAKTLDIHEVPVIIVNDDGKRSEFLRLVLNRSSEFQRWIYPDIDEYIDNTPQVQPLAEPLGLFGKRVLPVSYFTNSVINYTIDEYNEQQGLYRQEEGIAEWAKIQRERILKEEEERKSKVTHKNMKKNALSLFDMEPKDEDFLETYDIQEELNEHELKMREIAGNITDHYDDIRRKELGDKWQNTRRSSKEKSRDLRLEAEAEAKQDKE